MLMMKRGDSDATNLIRFQWCARRYVAILINGKLRISVGDVVEQLGVLSHVYIAREHPTTPTFFRILDHYGSYG